MNKDFNTLDSNWINSLDKGRNAALVSHVHKFMLEMNLYPTSKVAVVALSGGMDSMALAVLMMLLKKRGHLRTVELVHINHKLRKSNDKEQKFLKKLFPKLIVKTVTSKITKNIEHNAREHRYTLLNSELHDGDGLYLAHHLNDSFEWSLLQKMRSSELVTTLGIPVKRGAIRRPLMCMTREQIEHFVHKNKIAYVSDPTNEDTRFERNYLRRVVIPKLKERYPKYLKHYAARSNKLALGLGVYAGKLEQQVSVIESEEASLLVDFTLKNNFNGARDQLLAQIYRLSETNRGTYSQQVSNIIKAATNNKQGPLSLSGSLKCFLTPGMILIIKENHLIEIKNKKNHEQINETFGLEEFSLKLQNELNWIDFPFYVQINNPTNKLMRFKPHSIRAVDEFKGRSIWPALELLRIWSSDSYLKKKSFSLSLL